MSDNIKIREIEVKPGEKKHGFLEIAETASTTITIPVAIINGIEPGKKLSITAGVHCTEYEGIETVTRIYQEIDPMKLKGALLLSPVINTPGFQHGTIYVNPLDGKNMNRVYPGDLNGTISEKMIYVVVNELIRQCDANIDIHGGETVEDLGQYVIYVKGVGTKEVEEMSIDMARFYLPPLLREYKNRSGTSSSEIPRFGIPSITPEAGGLAAYREKDIEFHYRGIKNVMKWLGMLPNEGSPEEPKKDIPKISGSYFVNVKHGGIFYPCFRPFDIVKKGEVMALVKDMFGNIVEEVHAPADGIVGLLYPKRVKIAGENAYMMWTE